MYVVRADGTGLRQVTGDAALDRMPRWSSDGSRIAYYSNRGGTLQTWTIRPDGSGEQQLTYGVAGFFGVWAPDDLRFAVNVFPDELGRTVMMVDPDRAWDEQTPEWLPPPPVSMAPLIANDWSPDGRRLAGMTLDVSNDGILTYTFESGVYERLTDFGQWPVWLPDSRHLLFVSGGRAFYLLDSQTGEVREIFSAAGSVLGPPRIGRGGREIVYSRRVTEADIWLATIR